MTFKHRGFLNAKAFRHKSFYTRTFFIFLTDRSFDGTNQTRKKTISFPNSNLISRETVAAGPTKSSFLRVFDDRTLFRGKVLEDGKSQF